MREIHLEKTTHERMRMGETGITIYMDGSIESDGEGGLHVEIEIGIEQPVQRLSDEHKHFILIKKSMDVLAGMEHGEELWEDARKHARWILETMAHGIAKQSEWNDSEHWFREDSVSVKWNKDERATVPFVQADEIENPCHICDGDCKESGCLIGVRVKEKSARVRDEIANDIRQVLGL